MSDPFFKLLGRGTKFDKRKFVEDASIFQVRQKFEEKVSNTSDIDTSILRKQKKIKIYGTESAPELIRSFTGLEVSSNIHKNMQELGFVVPTPVQMQAIPLLLSKQNVIANAPTGSGKTLAYVLPILSMLKGHEKRGFRCLIVVPTKELAKQVAQFLKKIANGAGFCICLLRKAHLLGFKTSSTDKYDFLVTTPLTLVKGIQSEVIDLSGIEYLVFDEADKLLEEGFLEQIDEIVAACHNPALQTALFSATISSGVEALANSFMKDPVRLVAGTKNGASDLVKQELVYVTEEDGKMMAMRRLIHDGLRPPVLVFVSSIDKSKALFDHIYPDYPNVAYFSSEKDEQEREKIINNFRMGKIWMLITTDLLSRGMDFKGVKCVVNYDMPDDSAAYIHRIGRAGRAGVSGRAITFFCREDSEKLRTVANVMNNSGCQVPEWMLQIPKNKKGRKSRPLEA